VKSPFDKGLQASKKQLVGALPIGWIHQMVLDLDEPTDSHRFFPFLVHGNSGVRGQDETGTHPDNKKYQNDLSFGHWSSPPEKMDIPVTISEAKRDWQGVLKIWLSVIGHR
jgi:hypothetical protein